MNRGTTVGSQYLVPTITLIFLPLGLHVYVLRTSLIYCFSKTGLLVKISSFCSNSRLSHWILTQSLEQNETIPAPINLTKLRSFASLGFLSLSRPSRAPSVGILLVRHTSESRRAQNGIFCPRVRWTWQVIFFTSARHAWFSFSITTLNIVFTALAFVVFLKYLFELQSHSTSLTQNHSTISSLSFELWDNIDCCLDFQ